MTDRPLDGVAIDVQAVLNGIGDPIMQQSVSLHSYLVTRPTGRAVRMAIEAQLPGPGQVALSVIDFSEVRLIDYSCADEVVAKLLQRYLEAGEPDAYFVFRGIGEAQWEQIISVLERQGLAAVHQTESGSFELLGVRSDAEHSLWLRIEGKGAVEPDGLDAIFEGDHDGAVLDSILSRGLAFRAPQSGRVHALSRLVQHLL